MIIRKYSEKSFVVYGEDTRQSKELLASMGGRFNAHLKIDDKPLKGWIFPQKNRKLVEDVIMHRAKPIVLNKSRSYLPSVDDEDALLNHFYSWVISNDLMKPIFKTLDDALGITSQILVDGSNETYKFYGVGCGGSYLQIDKRCKKICKVYDAIAFAFYHDKRYIDLLLNNYPKDLIDRLKSEGSPITAIYWQDLDVNRCMKTIVKHYLVDVWGARPESITQQTYID